MKDEASLRHFFSILKEKKKSFDENYKYFAPKLAPKFSVFNFVRRDENALSYIISNLLDPNGDHAQGVVFIELFVEMLNTKIGTGKSNPLSNLGENIKNAKCVTESTTSQITNNQRRIDLVVNFGNFGIGIENKPWAFDQKDQLLDYSLEMQERYPSDKGKDFLLVYLTGGNWEIDEFTIPKSKLTDLVKANKFVQITYADIQEWMTKCEARCLADNVRNFVRDFGEYCEKEFGNGGHKLQDNLIDNYILSNEGNLSIAMEIGERIKIIQNMLYVDFGRKVLAILKEDDANWEKCDTENVMFFSLGKKEKTSVTSFKKKKWENHHFAFGYEAGLYWGVQKTSDKVKKWPKNVVSDITKFLRIPTKVNDWWQFWNWYNSPFKEAASDNIVWIDLAKPDSELVQITADNFIKLDKYLKKLSLEL